jgi:SAM-dependent methyltransferase
VATRTAQLNAWFETPLGQRILHVEMQHLSTLLPQLFGFHLVQIGDIGRGQLLESSRIRHKCIVSRSIDTPSPCLYAHATALPFANDSVDVVVLPHILDFEDHPHEVLREVQRVLIPEGHVIILGFNPLSLWGLWHWFLLKREVAPWCGRFLPILRIKDWLALLGLDVVTQHTFFFSLPLQRQHFIRTAQRLDQWGERWLPTLGAIYVLVACKRVLPLTLIRPRWQQQPRLVTSGAVGMNREL